MIADDYTVIYLI